MQPHPPSDAADARQAGFALVEVLAALAILALALAVLLSVLADGADRAAHAEKQASALLRAQSLLAAVGSEIALRQGLTTDEFDDGSRWQLSIEAYGGSTVSRASPVRAYRVSVAVSWGHGAQERSLTLSTLRLGPRETAK